MAWLIDANALLRHKRKMSGAEFGGEFWDEAVLVSDIKSAPTVDAVPVVRCKDCKYGEVDDADLPTQYLCNYHGADWNDENHFCSYGERKDGDGNG